MDPVLKDKIAVVTGANGGLGTSVVGALLDAAATVIGVSRQIESGSAERKNFHPIAADLVLGSAVRLIR